jgi:UPF0755 protein
VLRLINATLTFLVVLCIAVGGGLTYVFTGIDRAGPLDQSKVVTVPRNDGKVAIAERLEREGVIANRHTFLVNYWLLSRYADWNGAKPVSMKAGEYEFKAGSSLKGVIETLSDGRSVATKVTIPEGLTSYQIVERLKADQSLTGEIREIPAEGTLLPETYSVPRGAARTTVIELMQAAHKKLLEQLWAERQANLPLKTPQEALVMASIVEKETGRRDERDRVAAVFINRLRQTPPMRLQSDPTILYGLFLGKVAWGKPILRSEIQSNTAHNTYVINGLPPTPICNPGRQSLEATLRPAQTREIFFVADGQGGHVFTETLKDHNIHVARLRQMEAQRAAAAQQTPAQQSSAVPVTPQQLNAPGATAQPATGAAKSTPKKTQ